MRGKLIVIYGVNNLGKTTQAKLLVEKFLNNRQQAEYLKYPVYDLSPSGKLLNEYLRGGNPYKLSSREAQIIYAYNRSQFQPELEKKLASGINVVAEDFWGTGVAWGIGQGVDKKFLLEINQPFQVEDMAFLFTGRRFTTGIEENHLHEEDSQLIDKVASAHNDLAEEFGWVKIDANRSIEEISQDIYEAVSRVIG